MNYDKLLLSNQICFRLYTSGRLITQAWEPFLRKLGITYTQFIVLMVLWEQDEQPINDIGKRLMLGINTTSPLIKRMEKLGIVARHGNANDRRQQIVYLTEKGKALRDEAIKLPTCMEAIIANSNIDLDQLVNAFPLLDDFIDKMHKTLSEK